MIIRTATDVSGGSNDVILIVKKMNSIGGVFRITSRIPIAVQVNIIYVRLCRLIKNLPYKGEMELCG